MIHPNVKSKTSGKGWIHKYDLLNAGAYQNSKIRNEKIFIADDHTNEKPNPNSVSDNPYKQLLHVWMEIKIQYLMDNITNDAR